MGERATPQEARAPASEDEVMTAFARLLRERYGARTYLFGSRARQTSRPASDYDVVAVAAAFAAQPPLGRAHDRFQLWHAAGGWGRELDLHCLTPAELREELRGPGYLSQAEARGELIEVVPAPPTASHRAAPTALSGARPRRIRA